MNAYVAEAFSETSRVALEAKLQVRRMELARRHRVIRNLPARAIAIHMRVKAMVSSTSAAGKVVDFPNM